MPKGLTFRSELVLAGKTATGLRVPPAVVAKLGSGERPAVRCTLNGHTYRTTVAPMGGEFWIPVAAAVREAAGVAAGQVLSVRLELDTAPREVDVPADLAKALKRDKQAQAFFDALSYSNKRRIVLSIEGAKTQETRERRIAKAVEQCRAGSV